MDPNLVRAGGAGLGIVFGIAGGKLADLLPARYGITHLVTGSKRARRNVLVTLACALSGLGVAHVVTGQSDLELPHAFLLIAFHTLATAGVLAGAAIDLEHLILPNEITFGVAVLALATSPVRSIGWKGALIGAVAGLAVTYGPFLVYKKVLGRSGMGVGDAKLAVTAGAWHGPEGALFVLFAGSIQLALCALVLRLAKVSVDVPESVKAELAELRRRAEAGDAEARQELAEDPMAADVGDSYFKMRLPLGPFLTLACIEVLFARRFLIDAVFGWLSR